MAISRLGHIKEAKGANKSVGLKNCIEYIMNPEKTEGFKYIGVNNLYLGDKSDHMSLYNQMVDTKKAFDKLEGRQGYHYKFSFADQDNVTPELAMDITKEIIERLFTNYEAVYSVHTNTDHIHSHLVFNSIDCIDGYKYYYKNGDWKNIIQPVVNDICKKHGLSYIDLTTRHDKEQTITFRSYGDWKKKNNKKSNYSNPYKSYAEIRKDVDECIAEANDYEEFKKKMTEKGYQVNDSGKYIKILAAGRKKYVRLYTLTPDKATYTNANLMKMIEGSYKPIDRDMLLGQMYKDFSVFLNTRRIDIVVKKDRKNIDFAKAQETYKFLVERKITDKDGLVSYLSYLEQADKELNKIRKAINVNISRYEAYSDEMSTIISNIKYIRVYNETGEHKEERDKCINTYKKMLESGISPLELLIKKNKSERLLDAVDGFKRKIYVDKVVAKRALNKFGINDKNGSEKQIKKEIEDKPKR